MADSQEIHAALLRLRDKGCRVVASFGNISASGGVYVGVAAEKIVAKTPPDKPSMPSIIPPE